MNYLVDPESPVEEFLGIGKKAKAYKLQKRRDRQKAREDIAALGSGLIPLDENGKPRYVVANPGAVPDNSGLVPQATTMTNVPPEAGFKQMDNVPMSTQSSQSSGAAYDPGTNEEIVDNGDTNIPVKVTAKARKAPASNKTILYVGIGVVVLVLAFLMFKKK